MSKFNEYLKKQKPLHESSDMFRYPGKKTLKIDLFDVGSGLYKGVMYINDRKYAQGIFDEDDAGIVEQAINTIELKIERK